MLFMDPGLTLDEFLETDTSERHEQTGLIGQIREFARNMGGNVSRESIQGKVRLSWCPCRQRRAAICMNQSFDGLIGAIVSWRLCQAYLSVWRS